MAALFGVALFWLMVLKHDAFNTRTYDLARFDQAIWNTLHGRFLFSTILNHSILGNHFSPLMALLSPLFLVWDDVRVLFLVQVLGMAVAGLFLYQIVRDRHPRVAPWFLLAFYLNPALHEVTLFEFRRVTLAVPYLALALYALAVRKRWLMALGLGLALLCKEDMAFIVCMVGLYLLLFAHDWKWGVPLMAIGAGWLVAVSLWVIPAFAPGGSSRVDKLTGEGASVYPQLYYLDFLGSTYEEVWATLCRDPLILFRQAFGVERLLALGRALLPLGLILPFLAPDWLMLCLPTLAYLLVSNDPDMYRLEKWYMAPVLPVLFAAVGVGLGRLSQRRARWFAGGLLLAAAVGYALFSPAPPGARYDPSLYRVTEHHRLASRVVTAVPPDARVAAQPLYVPHLAHREHIYHYPWIVTGKENADKERPMDYFVLDRHSNPYPFSEEGINEQIDNMVADPAYAVELEADGIYLIRSGGDPRPAFAVGRVADGTMRLERAEVAVQGTEVAVQGAEVAVQGTEVAVQDEQGFFRPLAQSPVQLHRGQQVRVSLYWEALAAPHAERTVSVRIADASGALVAQYDGLPGRGKKPTSWWKEGWKIRDVYYLTVSDGAQPGPGSLDVLVYDSFSSRVVPFDGGSQAVKVCDVEIVPVPRSDR